MKFVFTILQFLQQILQGEVALQNSEDHLHITTIKVV